MAVAESAQYGGRRAFRLSQGKPGDERARARRGPPGSALFPLLRGHHVPVAFNHFFAPVRLAGEGSLPRQTPLYNETCLLVCVGMSRCIVCGYAPHWH